MPFRSYLSFVEIIVSTASDSQIGSTGMISEERPLHGTTASM